MLPHTLLLTSSISAHSQTQAKFENHDFLAPLTLGQEVDVCWTPHSSSGMHIWIYRVWNSVQIVRLIFIVRAQLGSNFHEQPQIISLVVWAVNVAADEMMMLLCVTATRRVQLDFSYDIWHLEMKWTRKWFPFHRGAAAGVLALEEKKECFEVFEKNANAPWILFAEC